MATEQSSRFNVPLVPNRPLASVDEAEAYGAFEFRYHAGLDFAENALFDPALAVYDDRYQNNQALSDAFMRHMRFVSEILQRRYANGAKLVEVGCGKGEFLELLQDGGHFNVKGYDAAYEGSNPAVEKRFLTAADSISADIVVLRHVLEHIQTPHEFLSLLRDVFGDTDIYVEVPEFDWIRKHETLFDVTYEHVNYFTPQTLAALFAGEKQQGTLFDEQYQYVIGNLGRLNFDAFAATYDDVSHWETLSLQQLFPHYFNKIDTLLESVLAAGRRIYVWGGATKGVMFVHHCLARSPAAAASFVAAVDINPAKSGNYMPSSKLPIIAPETFVADADGNETILVTNPNYRREIREFLDGAGLTDIELVDL